MNDEIIPELSSKLGIQETKIRTVILLLNEGATIPFIARYRKEATGGLNEEEIRSIEATWKSELNLYERKMTVIKLIDEKGLLTDELKMHILNAKKQVEVEDIYLPFKEKKITKATEAIKMGLKPLANKILEFPIKGSFEELCSSFKMSEEDALVNAGFIIAEKFSEDAYIRGWIRNYFLTNAIIKTKLKKDALDEKKTFENYYDYNESLSTIKHYRLLAINRAEKQKIISVHLEVDNELILACLGASVIKDNRSFVKEYVLECLKDALKRLIIPSITREVRGEKTSESETLAINNFKTNLEHLLLTRPLKAKRVLGFDPAFRTGCKLAVLDYDGTFLEKSVIYPHEPKNEKAQAKETLLNLIAKYKIDIIAIGNGTASRESETFVAEAIKGTNAQYIIVSEAGASVYSASPLAKSEFPDLNVEERSAISIGRRIQDPLSELVKIDPKSIGIGEYQHDVNQTLLSEALDWTTSKVVNKVGVSLNTAGASILTFVSGLSKKVINEILSFRLNKGLKTREDLKNVKGMSEKTYEQCIGFLRLPNSQNLLDQTGIHPESYSLTEAFLKKLNLKIEDLWTEEFKKRLRDIDLSIYVSDLKTDEWTLSDIREELLHPGLDPRENLEMPLLRKDILKIEDLKKGMHLEGTVRSVLSFGAFVDIGLHDNGLIHISKMSEDFVKDPNDILKVGDVINVLVDDVNLEKQRVSLSLLKTWL